MAYEQPMSGGGPGGGAGGAYQQADPVLDNPGYPVVSNAASAAMATAQQQAAIRAQQGGPGGGIFQGGGLTPAIQMPHPTMPQAPTHGSPVGIPQGPFGTVGERKRADKQALFSSIGNLVNQARDKMHEKKVQTITNDLKTLGDAITGYNEGMQTGNQEMIKQNAQVINRLLHDDPKKAKELQKVFQDVDMNPLAPKKGKDADKPDEYKDASKRFFLQAAQEQRQGQNQLSPQARIFMKSAPTTLQADPRWTNYLEGLKVGAFAKEGEKLKFESDMSDIAARYQMHKDTIEDRDMLAKNMLASLERRTSLEQTGATMRTYANIASAEKRQEILRQMWTMRADKALEGTKDRTQAIRDVMGAKGVQDKAISETLRGLDQTGKTIEQEFKDAQKKGDTAKMKDLSDQAERNKMLTDMVTAEAARRMGLDPKDFSQGVPEAAPQGLRPEDVIMWNTIFGSAAPATPEATTTK